MANNNANLQSLFDTISILRGENGCPWDRKQTCASLTQYLQSECDELIAAIHNHDQKNICEEIGDVLYVLLMITEINNDKGSFDFSNVIQTINEKLVRRHPHVFAGEPYESEEQLAVQWQQIKASERK